MKQEEINKELISNALGEIDDKYINLTMEYRNKRKKQWLRYGGLAAGIALLVIAGIRLPQLFSDESRNSTAKIIDGQVVDHVDDSGIIIPAVEIQDSSNVQIAASMIGLVVYQGKIYTQSNLYEGEKAKELEALVGEHLGYATGSINEWSTQEEYAVEFASTVIGDIYSVNGYDATFRLCMKSELDNGDGTTSLYIEFFDNLNGITLYSGSDIFEERLHLSEHWISLRYLKHEDWDMGLSNYQEATGITETELNTFFAELDQNAFEYVYEKNPDFYSDGREQVHLYLTMQDGTEVKLRLFEDGYVGYDAMGWYFVKMPGEAFDTIFNACK